MDFRSYSLCLTAFAAVAVMRVPADPVVFPEGDTVVSNQEEYTSGEVLSFGQGAKVTVANGGSIMYSATPLADSTTPLMTMGAGSELEIQSGGSVAFTDFAGLVSLAGTTENPALLTVNGGSLLFDATRYSNQNMLGKVSIGANSSLVVKNGGTFEMRSRTSTSSPRFAYFSMAGGTVLVQDNSVFYPGDMNGNSPLLSNGYTEFSGDSTLDFTTHEKSLTAVMISTTSASSDMTAEVVFKDRAHTVTSSSEGFGFPVHLYIANGKKEAWSILRLHSSGVIALGAKTFVGVVTGSLRGGGALLDITNGYAQSGGNYGLMIAHAQEIKDYTATGIVNVAGGALVAKGSRGGNNATSRDFCGTIVGCGPVVPGTEEYAIGELNVSGGSYTNIFGYFAVGVGRSFGRVLQTGGEIRSTPSFVRPMTIGFAGGRGEFIVSNGVTSARSNIYVGGAPLEEYEGCVFNAMGGETISGYDYSQGGAQGRLVVAAADLEKECSVAATDVRTGYPGHIVVGTNGTGTVEIGAGGTLTVNGANFTGSTATLLCTLGENGAGMFRIKGELAVAEGAKLVVDTRRLGRKSGWFRLVNANTRTGSFTDVSILGKGEVVQNREADGTGSIWLRVYRGMGISIR